MPFLHSDIEHLASNSIPFIVLGWLIIYLYRKVVYKTFIFIWIFSGIGVWLVGQPDSVHIGASGLVYGMAFFLFFSGVFRNDIRAAGIALFVAFVYGSIVWGLFPIRENMSWEGHSMGAIAGVLCAFYFRKIDPPPQPEWMDEEEHEEPEWEEMEPETPQSPPRKITVHYHITKK